MFTQFTYFMTSSLACSFEQIYWVHYSISTETLYLIALLENDLVYMEMLSECRSTLICSNAAPSFLIHPQQRHSKGSGAFKIHAIISFSHFLPAIEKAPDTGNPPPAPSPENYREAVPFWDQRLKMELKIKYILYIKHFL